MARNRPTLSQFETRTSVVALRSAFYRHLAPEQHAEAHSIAVERHHALNWLCGEGASWDDVPLDT